MVKETMLKGIIVVHDFDSSGNPVRFALLTNDEKKFIINPAKMQNSMGLADYNRKKVLLTGIQSIQDDNNEIYVEEIQLLKDSSANSYLDVL